MKFLVTGGAGFIGSHLVERLAIEGNEVIVLDDFNDFYDPALKETNLAEVAGRIRLVRGDIRDRAQVEAAFPEGGVDVVVHLAARAGVRPSIQDPQLYIDTNVTGTQNLLETCRRRGAGKFIFASSSSVYGLCREIPFREDVLLQQTISPYAATKIAGEHLCSNYAHLYELPVVCLRFFTVYGPRQRPDLAIHSFTHKIWHGLPITQFGDGSTRRDYTYVDDIVAGILGAIEYDRTPFEIFNLGESETTRLSTLISTIEDALERKAVVERLPEQPGDVPLTFADISKAKEWINYRPRTKIDKGIPKFVQWYLARAEAKR